MIDSPTDPESLLERFGLSRFRPGQRDVIDAVIGGSDVLCVMPTGGGKSLCYQLPSLARGGTTIVISPLIALMKDQIDTLRRLGINARLINSSLTLGEQESVMRELAAGALPMVYVAPERLRNGRFLEAVAQADVTLLAVDEAHCVSEWGHDFRPDYARLGHFRERYLGGVQTIALTATATPTVRDDVSQLLGLRSPTVFVTGFARDNLRFAAESFASDREKDDHLERFLRERPGSGIIYAATRKRCEELARNLAGRTGRPIGVYHGGMPPPDRRRIQEAFMGGDLDAIVATNAFGMGIDKADIRSVVHYNIPGSLEAYYQEAGRAGRDGELSDCLLMFSYQDRYIQEFFIENRYPSQQIVRKVYEFLIACPEDPIELTLDEVREMIGIRESSESVGTAETLLARAGVLKRLDSNANQAIVRIDSDAPTMLDFLPREAKRRRQVMAAVEKVVGERRGEDVYVRPDRLAQLAEMPRDQLTRTLRELQALQSFDYVPPFRGRAVHFLRRDLPFDKLEIDFAELERRKQAEYQKLEAVIAFARSAGCRQRVILEYFGDPNRENCGRCDRCAPADAAKSRDGGGEAVSYTPVDSDALQRGLQIVLSGVARMHGRFGKNLVAQMLCGSKNKKLQQWKLHRLSTYGLLSPLSQSQVTTVIDAAADGGLIEQREVDERRPTVHLTDLGRSVMKGQETVPASFRLDPATARRLAAAAREVDPGSGPATPADTIGQDAATDPASPERPESCPTEAELRDRLTRFRRKRSAALGVPAFRVLTNATIARIVEQKPTSPEELAAVEGIGPATLEQFGPDLLGLIREVLGTPSPVGEPESETSAAGPAAGHPSATPETSDDPNLRDALWTWQLFRDGYTCEQICEIRRSHPPELTAQLLIAAAHGHPVREDWASDDRQRQTLREAITRPGHETDRDDR